MNTGIQENIEPSHGEDKLDYKFGLDQSDAHSMTQQHKQLNEGRGNVTSWRGHGGTAIASGYSCIFD